MVDLPVRFLQNPKVVLGVSTAALVALATGGTTLLVSHGTRQLQPTAPVVAAPQVTTPPRAPVVVDRAPGSIALPRVRVPVLVPAAQPVVPGPVVAPPAAEPPVVEPPVVEPPVVEPPVVEPPVVEPPVVGPPVVLDPDVTPGHGHHARPAHPEDNGKHLGQLKH